MFIQSHTVGLVSLFSGVPIFFSQNIQINDLDWVLCDPGGFGVFFLWELKLKKLYWQVQISVDQKQSQFLSNPLKTKIAEFYSALLIFS